MNAYVLNEAGSAEQLQLVNLERPIIKDSEVLIKSVALSINPVDVKTRSGKAFYTKLKTEAPLILGWDVSGIIEEVGKNVTEFKAGDEVFGMVNFPGHGNAYAEYVAAPANQLALKPKNVSHEEAAAATLAALTAYQFLNKRVKSGDKVLIHAASGGVGHYAVQIAKILGATVSGTTSERNIAFVKSLGADEVIDYTKQPFEEVAKDFDFVLDALSGETLQRSIRVVKNGGTIITMPSGADLDALIAEAAMRDIKLFNQLVQSNGQDMEQIASWLESGQLKSEVAKTFDFSEMTKAHNEIETGRTRGKIVIRM
ncbi:MAG: NADP-dependent oxidoreductase [Flavobacterium sp.]